MDELTLLRNFHRDPPGPSAAETSAARTRLLDAIDHPQPVALRLMAARRCLGVLAVLGHRQLWAPVSAAAAVTAVVIMAAVVSAAPPQPARTASPSGSLAAASVLREAAAAAARQPSGHGRYFAAEIEAVNGPDTPGSVCCNAAGGVIIQWIGNGVTGRLARPSGVTISGTPDRIYFGSRALTWAQFQRLPTAPRQLQAAIAQASAYQGVPQVSTEFTLIADLLATAPGTPALRSALYQVAATLPGLVLVQHARDPIGRAAIEVYPRASNITLPGGVTILANDQALYFSPSTSAVLDLAQRNCSKIWGRALLASGYVSSDHQLPAGAVQSARPVVQLRDFTCAKPSAQPSPTVTSSPAPAATRSPSAVPSSAPAPVTAPPPTPSPAATATPSPSVTSSPSLRPTGGPAPSSATPSPRRAGRVLARWRTRIDRSADRNGG
jgi:hypothetical protein